MIGGSGQWVISSDDRRWWFDSGATAFDLVYTKRFETDFGSFVAPIELAHWLTSRFDRIADDIGEREIADAEALRAAITALARATARHEVSAATDIDVVNLYAATPDIPPVLAGSTRQAGRSGIRPGQALSSIAREAIGILGPDGHDRVRECEAADCQLVFYDDSRAASRRWCSMQRCGNRAKVRAFRARQGA